MCVCDKFVLKLILWCTPFFRGLDFNQLSVVQPGTLDPLTNLVELYMNSNPISNFSPNLFSTMGLLQTLHLGSTNATEVGGGSFRGLRSLQILGLEGNEITRLAQGSFAELSVLRVLYLHFNNLTAVPPGAFAACATTLEELYLENNFVTAALNVTFAGLTALRILRLDSNELTTADKSVFFSMTSMQHLRLGGNWLQFDATFPTVLRSGFFNGERVASVRCLNSRNGPAYIFNREADVDCCTLGGPGSCSPPPTFRPSVAPIAPTSAPTSSAPTTIPTSPRPTTTPTSASPTRAPITATPTDLPSAVPSLPRTNAPTQRPTTQQLTGAPSRSPLVLSSQAPSASTPQIGSDSSSDSGKSTKLTVTVAIVLVLMLVGIAWILWCRARRQHRDKAPQKNSGMTPVVNVTFQPEATFHTAHSKGGIYAVPFETPNSQHVDTAVSLTHYETPEVLILGSAGAGPVRLDESNYVGTPGGLATAAESPYDTSRTQKVLYSKFCDPPEIRQSENAYATSATAVDV